MQATLLHRLLPIALAGCALVGLFAACGQQATNVERGNRNNELYFGIGVEPAALDPHITTGLAEFHVLNALFEGLTTLDARTMQPQPGVAASWDISEDGLSYTFHLDPQARWSNGDRITAADFKYSIERILTPELAAPYAYMLYDVLNAEAFNRAKLDDFKQVGVSAPNESTLLIRLEKPTPYFLSLFAHNTWFPVHPPTIEAHGGMSERISKWTKSQNFVGNGPFTLERWRLNDAVYTRRNPHYRNHEAVKLNAIHFVPYLIPTEERAFRSNQIHITDTIPAHRIEWYQENRPEAVNIATALESTTICSTLR